MAFLRFVIFMMFLSLVFCEDSQKQLKLEEVMEEVMSLKRTLIQQKQRIDQLERKSLIQGGTVLGLHKRIKYLESNQDILSSRAEGDDIGSNATTEEIKHQMSAIGENRSFRKERLLAPQPTQDLNMATVAFHAYLSRTEVKPGPRHTLAFDHVVTNIGNYYHPGSGIFFAPRNGLYVFTWTIRKAKVGAHGTQLIVSNSIAGWSYIGLTHNDDISVSATVVMHINQGDDVLVRTHDTLSASGDIWSDTNGRSTFAGWTID